MRRNKKQGENTHDQMILGLYLPGGEDDEYVATPPIPQIW